MHVTYLYIKISCYVVYISHFTIHEKDFAENRNKILGIGRICLFNPKILCYGMKHIKSVIWLLLANRAVLITRHVKLSCGAHSVIAPACVWLLPLSAFIIMPGNAFTEGWVINNAFVMHSSWSNDPVLFIRTSILQRNNRRRYKSPVDTCAISCTFYRALISARIAY